MIRALDDWISKSASVLDTLPRESFALFFAYLAERLMPLYVAFEKKHRWGDSSVLQRQLESIWNVLTGVPEIISQDGVRRLADVTPSGEDFDSPDSTYAQDAIVCLDAAWRALIPGEVLDGNWVEYALEPIKTKVSIEKCGYSSVEGDAGGEWEAKLMADPHVAAFLRDCEDLLSRIQTTADAALVAVIRSEAKSKKLRSEDFIH
jgi:uncharacterized protein YjaG (DUF416 family)